ncbi:MAG: hypothetical protein IPM29_32395 [Planctomycetes bacterium]|nr:hypothetical protein [Planctomycetota bacterium]
MVSRSPWLWCAALAAACSAPAPDPLAMRDDLPAAVDVPAERRPALDAAAAAARAELRAGEFPAARRAAAEVLAVDPRHARARAVLGAALAGEAQREAPPELATWRRAEGELLRADRLAPDDPVVAALHVGFLIADGHLSAAAERAERGLAAVPDDLELLELAGRARFDLGDEQRTRELALRQVARDPQAASAWWRAAWCAARLAAGALDDAERTPLLEAARDGFRAYRELAPLDPDGYAGEARVRHELLASNAARSPDAVRPILELWTAAELLRPQAGDYAFGRAVAHELVGERDAAEAEYRDALAIDAAHLPSLLNLGALLADAERPAEAAAVLRRALALGVHGDERDRIEAWLARHAEGTAASPGDWRDPVARSRMSLAGEESSRFRAQACSRDTSSAGSAR